MIKELILKGIAASRGTSIGVVKIVLNTGELSKVSEGDVLVAKFTQPAYTVAMLKACAFVTDVGGICSHAAMIARELGVPCVVNTGNATTVLKDGQRVIVDGDNGLIFKES
ncbi:MAG: PEP-utilizing enzyme [Sphaerochaetaceae bacterium]|nr:PEP-utilizing enzyme [Sphaerochaetaceae bacterium]